MRSIFDVLRLLALSTWKGFKHFLVTICLVAAVPAGIGLAFLVLLYADLPGTIPPARAVAAYGSPSVLYDAAGNPIATLRGFAQHIPVTAAQIPTVLKNAVVASEDHTFWTNNGVDLKGVVRAALADLHSHRAVEGASTITGQYVKLMYGHPGHRSIGNKITETILAPRVARSMTKDQLLYKYLNLVYFGDGAYGIGAAAEDYFGVPVSKLTLNQAATLVGIIPAPSARDPRVNPAVTDQFRQVVLSDMQRYGYLTSAQVAQADTQHIYLAGCGTCHTVRAAGVPAGLASGGAGQPTTPSTVIVPPPVSSLGPYPYWTQMVLTYLQQHGYTHDQLYNGGLKIYTTLNPSMQAAAQAQVNAALAGQPADLNESLVSVQPSTGYIQTWIGGQNYQASQVDLASGGTEGFQPGSSFKPFALALALQDGMNPDTTMIPAVPAYTIPNCTGACVVHNNAGEGTGAPMSITQATWLSINTVFVQLEERIGVHNLAVMANKLGVSSIDPAKHYGASLVIGGYTVSPLDMAAAYSVFADQGIRHPATPVIKVVDPSGRVLLDNSHDVGTRVLAANVANTVSRVLTGVIKHGTGYPNAEIGRPAAGKTGTTDGPTAAWFVGYTPQLATAVWMGYADHPRPLVNVAGVPMVYGGTVPASTWAAYMKQALATQPPLPFPVATPITGPEPAGPANSSAISPPPPTIVVPVVGQGTPRSPSTVASDCGGPCSE